jgi:hypothetical protein
MLLKTEPYASNKEVLAMYTRSQDDK